MRYVFALLAMLGWLALPSASAMAQTRVISSGILTGVNGLDVNGTFYDVSFQDGTCAQIFGGCVDQNEINSRNGGGDPMAALNALRIAIFFDGPLGNFDSNINLTFGCSDAPNCAILTPIFNIGDGRVAHAFFLNLAGGGDFVTNGPWPEVMDTSESGSQVFAVFTPSAVVAPAVPEPDSWVMLIAGFALTGVAMRRRQPVRSA